MKVDYIEYKTTHADDIVTYSQATQAILDAPQTTVKVEQVTNYENGSQTIVEIKFLIRGV